MTMTDIMMIIHLYFLVFKKVILILMNVLFVHFVFFPIEQADTETYLNIYVLIYHLTYICPSLFGCKENIILEETMIFKLLRFLGFLTNFERSKKDSTAGK